MVITFNVSIFTFSIQEIASTISSFLDPSSHSMGVHSVVVFDTGVHDVGVQHGRALHERALLGRAENMTCLQRYKKTKQIFYADRRKKHRFFLLYVTE